MARCKLEGLTLFFSLPMSRTIKTTNREDNEKTENTDETDEEELNHEYSVMDSVSETDKTNIFSVENEELDANDLQQIDFIQPVDSRIPSADVTSDEIIKDIVRSSPSRSLKKI
jgi:hypothetical protein